MLQNYFKIGWRSLKKNKTYAFINIFGLAVGISFALLIGSYIWGEWTVNSDIKNLENQYIIKSKWKQPNMGLEITTLAPLAKTLKANYPTLVENYYRFDGVTSVVSKGDKNFREEIQLGDSTLLTMYGFPLLYGNALTALNAPNSVVISSKIAIKYFGRTDVVGQSLQLESFSGERRDFMVSGVLAPIPYNSVTQFVSAEIPLLMPMQALAFFGRDAAMNSWDNVYVVNYIELKKGVKPTDMAKPIAQTIATNASEIVKANLEIQLTPLNTLYREDNNGLVNKTIATLGLVALFIILMAVVNFVNIAIGASSARLKEIGVRKALGSKKTQVIGQFLTESVILALLSTLLSLVLYECLRSYFGEVLGKELRSIFAASPQFCLIALLLGVFVGLMAGAYPAFVLSSLPSVDSIKGKLKNVKDNRFFRYSLMVGQFALALFVFGAAVVISQQVNYFFEKDLGYSKNAILWAAVPRDWSAKGVEKMETVRKEMARLAEVSDVSLSYEIPNGKSGFKSGLFKVGQDSTQATYVPVLQTDENYASTYQIPMVSGTFFRQNLTPNQAVINQKALKTLGFTTVDEAIGQQIRLLGFPQPFTVTGVTKDFHFDSMRENISPLVIIHLKTLNNYRFFSFKLRNGLLSKSLTAIETRWRQLLPGAPFEFKFLDDMFQNLYQTEIRLQKAAQLATILAIVIVLLGIVGMVSLSVIRRTKELGIRKVLGASVISLVMLFLKEFLIVSAVATTVAFPLVVFSMNRWLENYAYRISISWISLAGVGAVFGLLIVGLVGFQTFKATLINPTKSLRAE